jgi:hypothetical protein
MGAFAIEKKWTLQIQLSPFVMRTSRCDLLLWFSWQEIFNTPHEESGSLRRRCRDGRGARNGESGYNLIS